MAVRRARAESDAFGLLAREQPVAGELCEIVSSIQIMADAERMCALAVHAAKIARMRHPGHLLPLEVRACFAELGKVAIALGDSANQALVSHDPRTARLREEDEVMDNLHRPLTACCWIRIGSTVSQPPSTSRCWAASMSALPITPWRSGAGLSSWSPARCPR